MADYIQYSIDVEYEGLFHGRVETRTETFTTSALLASTICL